MGADKDNDAVLKALQNKDHREAGWDVRAATSNHYRIFKDGVFVTGFASTPSDRRGLKNALGRLRRAGFVWPLPPKKVARRLSREAEDQA